MKILHIIENLDDSYGGPAVSIPTLCKYLNELGTATQLVSIKYNDMEHNTTINKFNLKWKSFDFNISKAFRYSLSLKKYLTNIIKKESDIIIHTHNLWNYIPYVSYLMKKKYKILVVGSIRGSAKLDKLKKKIIWWLFQKDMLNKCDIVHVTRKDDIELLRNMGIVSKIAYIPNGIDLSEFTNMQTKVYARKSLDLKIDKQYILFLGRIHHKKGLDYLVNSWLSLAEKHNNWDLLIVGPIYDKKYYKNIKDTISKYNLSNRVHFKGILTGEEKLLAYSASDLFVLPSYSENFGMSIVEAMASKLPIITTHGTPWKEIKENNTGWWVDLNQKNIDTALIEALSLSQIELTKKGLNSFNLVQRYSWVHQAKKMQKMYKYLLDKNDIPDFISEYKN